MGTKAPPSRRSTVPDSLTRLGYKIRPFGSLPRGFNPLTATDEQLAAQRMPRRPDRQTEPRLLALWERSMTQTKMWIAPEFTEVKSNRPWPFPGKLPTTFKPPPTPPPTDPRPRSVTSTNWAGAIQLGTLDLPYTFVAAQWTVPEIAFNTSNPPPADTYWAAEWIGIDGWFSGDVLQAGTMTQLVVKSGTFAQVSVERETWAWWCWFPDPMAISNMSVSPGDVLVCLICADDTMAGATIYLTNLTTGVGTRFHVTPPSGMKLGGNSAEWIVERPTITPGWPESIWESPYDAKLPDYVECIFDECMTGGPNMADGDLEYATTITMLSDKNDVLSVAQIDNDVQLTVTWRKYG